MFHLVIRLYSTINYYTSELCILLEFLYLQHLAQSTAMFWILLRLNYNIFTSGLCNCLIINNPPLLKSLCNALHLCFRTGTLSISLERSSLELCIGIKKTEQHAKLQSSTCVEPSSRPWPRSQLALGEDWCRGLSKMMTTENRHLESTSAVWL